MAYQSKADWQRARIRSELARNAYAPTENINRFLAGKPMLPNKPVPDAFKKLNKKLASLNKQIDQSLKQSQPQPTRDEIDRAAKQGKTLVSTLPSSAFNEVSWRKGIVTAEFWNGYVYSAPMSKEDFLDWAGGGADSLGKYYNQVLGRDFFA
jgi:hypothetical protein